MPTTLTEADTFTASIAVPASGEARTAASVGTPFQGLTDRTHFLGRRHVNPGFIDWDGRVRIPGNGTHSVYVAPIRALCINGKVISSSIELSADSSGLSSNTWGYVYAYDNAGTLAIEVLPTAPDAALTYCSTDDSRRFLCSVRRLNTYPRSVRFDRGRCTFHGDTAGWEALGGGTATSFTSVNLAEFVPPHSRVAFLHAALNGATGGAKAYLKTYGTSDLGLFWESSPNTISYFTSDVVTSTTQLIEYKIEDLGSSSPALFVRCLGFSE